MRKFAIILLILVSLFFIFGAFHYKYKYNQVVDAPLTKDTVIIKDTIEVKIPIPKEIKILKTDTVYLPSIDDKDTIKALLPITEKVYGDSTFRAVISGYNPHLESLTIYPTTTTITERKLLKMSGNGFKISPSIGVGYGIINKNPDIYIGVSLIYEF